ncbi:zinc finger protein [Echinococcus multilocularis]|uniref:Zinc finger protein n=1 Tax=Echinococcus multilocularis TaxID=6211 RepID=A0A068YDV2_ECHMU|nr:zinc finger protein [Echinococcus multilocularis]
MKHVCDICGASFNRPSRLTIHQRIHTGERPFKCPCGRSYIRRQHLARHAATCAGTPTTPRRNKSLSDKSSDHIEYFCPKCNLGQFYKKKSVWAHVSIVHGDRRFKCIKCDAAFTTNSKLERHQKRHHDVKCQICNTMRMSSAPSGGICDVTDASASNPPPDFNERFENFNELRRHIAKHHPNNKFICKICNRRFSRRAHLLEHEWSHTPLEERRIFVCTHCSPVMPNPVAYTSKRGLMAHIRAVHVSELRRFPCTHSSCPAILSTKQKLKQHLRLHERESGSEVVRVFQRPSLHPSRRAHASAPPLPLATSSQTKYGAQTPRPKRQRCVPLRELQESWETDSQSSVLALLRQ